MTLLDPLLELQDLDLQADRLAELRKNLPERQALETCGTDLEENARVKVAATRPFSRGVLVSLIGMTDL